MGDLLLILLPVILQGFNWAKPNISKQYMNSKIKGILFLRIYKILIKTTYWCSSVLVWRIGMVRSISPDCQDVAECKTVYKTYKLLLPGHISSSLEPGWSRSCWGKVPRQVPRQGKQSDRNHLMMNSHSARIASVLLLCTHNQHQHKNNAAAEEFYSYLDIQYAEHF